MYVIELVIGLVALVGGAELLVRGGSHMALAFRVPILIVGLTLVAFGTSTPELAVSITAALSETDDLGKGTEMALANVNGSNMANILLVLGIASLVAPLRVDRRLMRREVPTLLALQFSVPLVMMGGVITRIEGFLLLSGGIAYNIWLVYEAMKLREAYVPEDDDLDITNVNLPKDVAMFVFGLVVMLGGAVFFVSGAVTLAQNLGFSAWFIGLTVLALGTSMPEVITGIVASWRGEVDLAIGNSLGSNILNISMVLGITAMIKPIEFENPAVWVDTGIVCCVALLLVPIVMSGSGRLSRLGGALMIMTYLAILAFPR